MIICTLSHSGIHDYPRDFKKMSERNVPDGTHGQYDICIFKPVYLQSSWL